MKNYMLLKFTQNQGPTLKRIRPAAKGSAVRIRKKEQAILQSC